MDDHTQAVSQNQVAPPSSGKNIPIENYDELPEGIGAASYPSSENRTKYIVIGVGVVVFIGIFIALFALLGKFAKPKGTVTLTYWGLWEDRAVFDPLIKSYQSKHPEVTVNYVQMDPQDYRNKLIERSKNGQGPDIFRFHNTWLSSIGEIVSPLPEKIMSNQEFEKTFYPVTQQDLKIDNFYYGIPLEIDGLILVYNEDLFKQAGIVQAPKTWEDVINDAVSLTVKNQQGEVVTAGIALGTVSNVEHFSEIFGWMLLQNGADLRTLSQGAGVDALEAYRRFAESPNNVWDEHMPNSIVAFIQEKVAMIIIPSWELHLIGLTNPELQFKTAVLPIIPGGNNVSLANYWVEGVSKLSKNQLEAWKFIKFLSEKDQMTELFKNAAASRLFGEPYSRVDLGNLLVQNAYIGPVIEQASFMKSLPIISRTFDNGVNDGVVKYIENAINATIDGVSYEEAASTAQKGIDQLFEQYQIP